ncbi:MAG: carboxypeptidase-like regulatory domain-containing protein, partial [Bacteroidota bacterium]
MKSPNYLNKITLVAICLATTFFQLKAQKTLSGVVVDAENAEVLIGANLFLAEDFSVGTQTDIDGKFAMLTKTAKTGTIVISYIGYEDQMVDFTENTDDITIKLQPKAATIETVVVKGKKLTGQVFAVEKIKKLDIYLDPSSQADALKAVQSNPAATTIDETANVSLRGSPASETGVLLNNVPINDVVRLDQSNGVGQFSIFNTSTIESVSVFASNPPLEFGNATSGVVALYTDDQLPEKANSISLNLVGLGLSASRKLGEKTSISAFSNWNTPYLFKRINATSLADLSNFHTLDLGISGLHQFNANWQFKFFNYSISENYQYKVRFPSFNDELQQRKRRNLSVLNLIQQKE